MSIYGKLPTTRAARFRWRQRRYTRRHAHQKFCWTVTTFDGVRWSGGPHWKKPNLGPLMNPPGVKRTPGGPFNPAAFPSLTRVVSRAGDKMPPHATLYIKGTLVRTRDIGGFGGWSFPIANFHRRRVHGCRPHKRSMTALQRRVWGANVWYHREGAFHPDDPLNRVSPIDPVTGQTILYVEGDWPTISPRDLPGPQE